MTRKTLVDAVREKLAERNGHAAPDPWPEDERGDEYQGDHTAGDLPGGKANGKSKSKSKAKGKAADEQAVRFELLDSAAFAVADYKCEWLIRRLLVRGQPAVIGGPRKSLKTSLLVDLAVSLGSGLPFLGCDRFAVAAPVKVIVLSGESGAATLQETARRVCAAKGIDLAGLPVWWGFKLPQLASLAHLDALADAIKAAGADVLLLDPLYLCLLAGIQAQGLSAANLYQIGPLLMSVAQTCLEVNCTPFLVHHFRMNRADPYGEPQLEDLAYAGVQEFARQWLLLGRREAYQSGSGRHALWMAAGGSAGHGSLWAVDIAEGTIGDDFQGRTWDVEVKSAGDARAEEEAEVEAARRRATVAKEREDDDAVMLAIDKLDPKGAGVGVGLIRDASPVSRPRTDKALARLVLAKIIERCTVASIIGNGAARSDPGFRRVSGD